MSALAKIASGREAQLKLNATGTGQIFVPLLRSSILAHAFYELCETVVEFWTTLLVLGLNKSIVIPPVPTFGFSPTLV